MQSGVNVISLQVYWLSDVIAGAIFGSLVGVAVGKSFKERLKNI